MRTPQERTLEDRERASSMSTAEATAPGVVGVRSSAADPILVADGPTAAPAVSAATTPATSAGSHAPCGLPPLTKKSHSTLRAVCP